MAEMRKRDATFAVRVSSHGQSSRSRVRVEAEAAWPTAIVAGCCYRPPDLSHLPDEEE